MCEALINLFQSSNANRKMVLCEKLKNIEMAKGESVIAYLTQVMDDLVAMGDIVVEIELVRTALFGVSQSWSAFV